ncbi:MAG TPA: cation:proton antiporter [Candidatus Polarisedimenticolaceae bacterium]
MHDVPLLINITVALGMAFLGGIAARKLGLPTIVGYLLAGIAIGPFTPGFVSDLETIRQLAELGVIFLMFGVGLHFSFSDLRRVRDIAIPGALVQTALATAAGVVLTRSWGWSWSAGLVLGLSISVASTVVLLRGLMDHSLLNTSHGRVAVGWLVMEDLFSVLILLLMPAMASGQDGIDWAHLTRTLLTAAAFVGIMLVAGVRIIPWLLERIAHMRSRELFVLVVLAITLGTAMAASELFGVSLALGAFLAGAVISESKLSHQVGADIFTFREAFSVLFFVSVGMLVNPAFLWTHLGQVALLTLLVVVGKGLIVILMGLFFSRPARTFLVVAVGLSQIGEFSFILGQAGLSLGLLDLDQYSLLLAGAALSITVNPFLFRARPRLETLLRRVPGYWKPQESLRPLSGVAEERLTEHVVVVGFGRVGKHLVDVLQSLRVPFVVIESDIDRIAVLNERGIPALYGDAANSEVVTQVALERARALVSTVPEDSAALVIVTSARDINPNLRIIARAATAEGVRRLAKAGAHHVIHPELEGGLELVHHTLLSLGYPLRQSHEYAESVRRDHYDARIDSDAEHRSLEELLRASKGLEITWMGLSRGSPLIGKTLAEADVRSRTGASVVALIRRGTLVPNPKSSTVFEDGDRVAVIGEDRQIDAARRIAESRD